jgi:predicted PurR-regulated permease PerM
MLSILKQSSNWLISGASVFVKGTTNFIISLGIILLTMYFFFIDGKKMLKKLVALTPWPQKYNRELFSKFQIVGRSTFLSSFVSAFAQGIVGAIGFWIVGFPPLLAGILVTILSILPFGSGIFYIPMAIFYLLIGDIWQGIFIFLWGILIISTIDNVIRAYMIKDEAGINPIFVILSVLGGIGAFGFWGVVLGPLIVALAITVLHIYELEFKNDLNKVTGQ